MPLVQAADKSAAPKFLVVIFQAQMRDQFFAFQMPQRVLQLH